jgi:type II secretory pathway pseudopilin PulG
MKIFALATLCSLALIATPVFAQDDSMGEVVVTASRMQNSLSSTPLSVSALGYAQPPVIGLKRQADSAVRTIEIVSDSRDEAVRKREVQAMLLDAIDSAKRQGLFLVTGQFELVEVTRANWKDQFPGLADKTDSASDDDDDYDDDDDNQSESSFEDDGSTATVRVKVKTKLDGSIGNAQQKITSFAKSVPVTGRSQIVQKGGLALTIINPEQYRDDVYKRIAAGAAHAASFYGPEYGLNMTGLDQALAWNQVSNTEVFLYIPYSFSIGK